MVARSDIIVYAVAQLGGATHPVHFEKVAVKCYELSPADFSWTQEEFRNRGWPNIDITRRALRNALANKLLTYRRLNVSLTPEGISWYEANAERLAKKLSSTAVPLEAELKETLRYLEQIKLKPLYKKWLTARLSVSDSTLFTDLLLAHPDAPTDLVSVKFSRLQSMAKVAKDVDASKFLDECNEVFRSLLEKRK